MPLTGWQAWAACTLAKEVQESGCTIPADVCELSYSLSRGGRLWIGLKASGCQLWGSATHRRAKLHITILTAYGIASAPPPDLLVRLLRSLQLQLQLRSVLRPWSGGPGLNLPNRILRAMLDRKKKQQRQRQQR